MFALQERRSDVRTVLVCLTLVLVARDTEPNAPALLCNVLMAAARTRTVIALVCVRW